MSQSNPNPFLPPPGGGLPGFPGAPSAPLPPQGYPGPAVPLASAPNPYAPAPGVAPAPAVNMAQVGAAIAAATLGVTRYPPLTPGTYTLQIELTKKPERSLGFVAELVVLESSAPDRPAGTRCSYYQNLGGPSQQAQNAQYGAALAFILRASGFADLETAAKAGWGQEMLASHINACFQEPGPLRGRTVRCVVSDSGKRTKGKLQQNGAVVGGGAMIVDYNWSPAT